jgi:sulfhydrogenase subunit alpha
VRAVEILYALDEALRLIDAYEPPEPPGVEVLARAGVGHGWTEAPRGMLYHRYEIDGHGTILDARIVPPTSQNQARIEDSLRGFVQQHVDLDDDELRLRCEQAVRAYDPCISCATHFLRLQVDRG